MREQRCYDRSLELFQQAYRLIPGGSQTNSKRPQGYAYGAYPIFAQEAEGSRIWDIDGNEYIDLVNGLGPIILGYRYPAVTQAIAAQLEKGVIAGLLWPVEVEAAQLLTEMVPCAEMVRYFKGGGEATAAAARIARAYTGREIILNYGYRGWPDVWTATRNDGGVPRCLERVIVEFPWNDLGALESLFQQYRDRVALVFLNAQYEAPAPGYLQAVIDLAHRNGALFALDEVVTGFRMAVGGAQEYFGVTPDLACFAKAMANGMPLSAVVGQAEVMRVTEKLRISITYGGEALSLAAAVASMREIRDRDVPAHLWKVGAQLMEGLDAAAQKRGVPFRCWSCAPWSRMEFVDVAEEQDKLAWSYLLQEMATRGVLLRRTGPNFATYSHTEADIAYVVRMADEVFADLASLWDTAALAASVRARDIDTALVGYTSPGAAG